MAQGSTPTQMTHKYIPRIAQRQDNLFIEEYYSGTDTKIYIDNEEQTEIGYINYSMQEQLKPIYNYTSKTWDDVSVGTRIVTGSFKVPIKNPEDQAEYDVVVTGLKEKPTYQKIQDLNNKSASEAKEREWITNDTPTVVTPTEEYDDKTPSNTNNPHDNDTPTTNNKPSNKEDDEDNIYSDEVLNVETQLKQLGYTIVMPDGYMDSLARLAIFQFCADNNVLPLSNEITPEFKKAIATKVCDPKYNPGKTLGTTAIVKTGPDDSFSLKTTFQKGTEIMIIGACGDYVCVMNKADGTTGYVRKIFVM